MSKKICNVILIILIIAFIIVMSIIITKRIKHQIKEKELVYVVNNMKEDKAKIETKYKGYNVVGIIKISKINIEYPIIEKTDNETMKCSITKFWGNNVNDIGNFVMAGHNYFDGTMFSNTNKLIVGDTIEMTDLNGNTIEYKVFYKDIIDPNDLECVKSVEENTREITLITCINGRKNRLIIKARESI